MSSNYMIVTLISIIECLGEKLIALVRKLFIKEPKDPVPPWGGLWECLRRTDVIKSWEKRPPVPVGSSAHAFDFLF